MQPVGRLLEDDRRLRLEDVLADFLPPVRGQAVHEDGPPAGPGHQRGVHLVRPEDRDALVVLGLLPHARPGVGVDHVGGLDRLRRLVADRDAAAGRRGVLERPRHDTRIGRVTGRQGRQAVPGVMVGAGLELAVRAHGVARLVGIGIRRA